MPDEIMKPGCPFPVTPTPPELIAYMQQTIDRDAFEAEVEELRLNGGVSFEEVLAAIDRAAAECEHA